MNWGTVCRAKQQGGFINAAFLGKWIWKFFNCPNLLWRKLINFLYYKDKNIREGGAAMKNVHTLEEVPLRSLSPFLLKE